MGVKDSENQRYGVLTSHHQPKQPHQDMVVKRQHGRSLFCLSPCFVKWMAFLVPCVCTFLFFFFLHGRAMTLG